MAQEAKGVIGLDDLRVILIERANEVLLAVLFQPFLVRVGFHIRFFNLLTAKYFK